MEDHDKEHNDENINNEDNNDYGNEGEIDIGENGIVLNNTKNENSNNSQVSPTRNSSERFKRTNSLASTVIGQNTVYVPPWKKKARNILDSPPVQLTMTVFTIYILFADDIKVICTTKKADPPFSTVVIILMIIFFIELVISAIVQEDYFLGFYFWLDFVSLISMVLDIHWFYDWMINSISGGGSGVKKAKTIGAIAKAGKSAKIAARAIRILRVLRIIRLVRVSKLYKAREQIIKMDMKRKEIERKKEQQEKERQKQIELEKKKEEEAKKAEEEAKKKAEEDMKKGEKEKKEENNKDDIMTLNKNKGDGNKDGYSKLNINEEQKNEEEDKKNEEGQESDEENEDNTESISKTNNEETGEVPEESKVGKLLADRTTKKVIILILSMMIGIILFNTSFYLEKKTGMEMGLKLFSNFASMNDPDLNLSFSIYVSENLGTSSPMVYAKVGYLVYDSGTNVSDLREQEKNAYSEDCSQLLITDGTHSICEATFDVSKANRLSAILNIVKTCFICVVLTVSSYCFSKDTSEMVLEPIETMISKVKEITKNPIEALQKNEKEEITKALIEEEEQKNAFCNCDIISNKNKNTGIRKKKEAPLETEVLENTITKIGALLALSFGDAGSEIIAKNMQKNSSGEVNPMIPGKKVCAIYGFCDIRNFTDTTEILQEKVMVFVNEIAEVVHELTSEYGGSANKNIGDAFLLVWKFPEKFCFTSKKTNELMVYNCDQVNQLCDMALISIILVLAKIYKSKTFEKYRTNEKLIKKFNGYSVKLGFGLHLGWSIEGAIGSAFKIDASYLSPNANMANTCEEKTKDYGALMIMTDKFIENLSEEAQRRCRIVDIINGDEPVGFYTIDLDLTALSLDEEESDSQNFFDVDEVTRKMTKYQKRMKRKKNIDDAFAIPNKKKFWLDFEESSEDFATMRGIFTDQFYDYYNEGFDEFNFGDWKKAKRLLEEVLKIKSDDKPTIRMLEKMKKYNYKKPSGWIGNTE